MWREDVRKWQDHLGPLQQTFYEIPLLPVVINNEIQDVMDSADAIPKIEAALTAINALAVGEKIRLVALGTGYSHFLYEAITYLLKEWKEPNGRHRAFDGKHLQFITSGDTEKRCLSDFCQWLCISGACRSVEFRNTMKYNPFGYCSSEYPRI